MIKLQTNGDIIMSTGDESSFTFYLNVGDSKHPMLHYFRPNIGECLHFIVLNPNHMIGEPLLIKTFKDNGDIITEKKDGEPVTLSGNKNIDDNGNMIVSFSESDTSDFLESPYKYQVKAKIITYDLLDCKPSDWDEDCTKYYIWNPSTGLYDNVPEGTEWSTSGRFYNKNDKTRTVTNRHNFWLINDDYCRNW